MTLLPISPQNLAMTVPPTVAGLTDEERAHLQPLNAMYLIQQFEMRRSEAYYLGTQRIDNLGIAVPQELEFLRTIVGWPALAVDPYVERLIVDSYRLPGSKTPDSLLTDIALLNNMDAQLPFCTNDALALGRGFWVGGVDEDGNPKITAESPLNMAVKWDGAGSTPVSAWQVYWQDGRFHGVLMMPDRTVVLTTDDGGDWQILDRNVHNMGWVPLKRMPHAPRTNARDGRSAITPTIRSITDSACRDLLSLEVAREFYSIPRVMMLGATEADFVNSDGSVKTAWETLISKFNAFQRDDEGNTPDIKQIQAYDPSVFTKLIEMRASQMAAHVAAPPQDLGLYTSGNPTSADAVDAMETRRARRAKLYQNQFGQTQSEAMQMAVAIMNKGTIPSQYARILTDWVPVEEVNPVSASQSALQQVQGGIVPPTSDVLLRRLGYSALERAQIADERQHMQDQTQAQQIIDAVKGANGGPSNQSPFDSAHQSDNSDTGQAGVNGETGSAALGGSAPGSMGLGIGDPGGGLGR